MRFALPLSVSVLLCLAATAPGGARRGERPRETTLKVGDAAPDFELQRLGAKEDEEAKVKLSSFQGQRPVVLIFGSYT